MSASHLGNKSPAPRIFNLRRPQYSDPERPQCNSSEEQFANYSSESNFLTPRISIDEPDSQPSPPSFQRPYLKYQARAKNSPVHKMDSEDDKEASLNSKPNLQICQSREDGSSFSFSDLDPVQEDLEVADDDDDDLRKTVGSSNI